MFDSLLEKYIDDFHLKGEVVVKSIVNCSVPSKIVLEKYKSLPPIETMEEKDKIEMWNYMKELFPDKSKEERIRAAKIYYTIGTIINGQ